MAPQQLLTVALAVTLSGCGVKHAPEASGSAPAADALTVTAEDPGEAPGLDPPRRGASEVLRDLLTPKGVDESERRLVEALAAAIEARDFDAMAALTTAELAADMGRMREEDARGFWRRGQVWVDNVRSGVETAHREAPEKGRWRALLRFGNSVEETVVFVRHRGMLRFEQL